MSHDLVRKVLIRSEEAPVGIDNTTITNVTILRYPGTVWRKSDNTNNDWDTSDFNADYTKEFEDYARTPTRWQ